MNNRGIVFLGERNSGKTTMLLSAYENLIKRNKKILVIDSATEHIESSLLQKIKTQSKSDYIWIDSCSEAEIVFPKKTDKTYPYTITHFSDKQVYLCDAAYYLERGYDYPEGDKREEKRLLYKRFCMQTVEVLMNRIDAVIMDEIELIPESERVIREALGRGTEIYMALHYTSGLCGMQDLFQIKRMNGNEE